jgi:hypothetical protein
MAGKKLIALPECQRDRCGLWAGRLPRLFFFFHCGVSLSPLLPSDRRDDERRVRHAKAAHRKRKGRQARADKVGPWVVAPNNPYRSVMYKGARPCPPRPVTLAAAESIEGATQQQHKRPTRRK